jgi:hypothetical protein
MTECKKGMSHAAIVTAASVNTECYGSSATRGRMEGSTVDVDANCEIKEYALPLQMENLDDI